MKPTSIRASARRDLSKKETERYYRVMRKRDAGRHDWASTLMNCQKYVADARIVFILEPGDLGSAYRSWGTENNAPLSNKPLDDTTQR